MAAPAVTRQHLTANAFFDSELAASLRREPIGVWDIGARWGVDPLFHPVPELCNVVSFEADAAEAERLRNQVPSEGRWAGYTVSSAVLAGTSGPVAFHLLGKPNNSSIYPARRLPVERYGFLGFDEVSRLDLVATTVDELRAAAPNGLPAPEIVKIDVQGAEHDILRGAHRALAECTLCIVCETQFMPAYEGIKLFSEIELLLRDAGFAFYGFLDPQHRATKRIDKRQSFGRERLIQADAVFFKDPFDREPAAALARRMTDVLTVAALLLGFFDFASELADAGARDPALRALVSNVARADTAALVSALEAALMRAQANAGSVTVAVGKLIDAYRDYQTFHDLKD
ncbi:MAG TPA: FkbM family methyltransferase [Candidatus Sulfotelmatobacter sp.]|nr:FkbM family methyltransferase [Candidatus Sulfotelmatobacter sp.]